MQNSFRVDRPKLDVVNQGTNRKDDVGVNFKTRPFSAKFLDRPLPLLICQHKYTNTKKNDEYYEYYYVNDEY